MADDKTIEPADDAAIVHDEAAEERANDELVAQVAKMLDPSAEQETEQPPGAEPETTADDVGEKKPSEKDEESELGAELLSRAEDAGITKELAERLHQTGHLEETLAAFDRKMIERFQSTDAEEKPKRRESKPPQKEPEATDLEDDVPNLDPDIYDEELVKRDAFHKRRIDALEAQLSELLQQRHDDFDERFDGMVEGLGHDSLFGKGQTVSKDKQANRDKLFRAYEAVCMANDVDPHSCNPECGKRALAAMFPEEFFKQAQRQTIDRLRDAEGKFLSSSRSKGAPPSKNASPEEVHEQLVSNVTTYLKKQGVQMSGV